MTNPDPNPTAEPLPWDGQPYSIKRHGVTITNCDREPVHTPGCIQGHGVLLALRLSDLTILQVSDNTAVRLGQEPEALLGQSVATAIGIDAEARLREFLATESTDRNALYVLTLPADGGHPPLDLTVHTIEGVALVELEATGRTTGGEPDYYDLVRTATARLRATETLDELCSVVCEVVQRITGLDRVMVYKFHDDDHGEVIAERKRADLPTWHGLHYPADDIPKPARRIFEKIWVRPVLDVSADLAELYPLRNPDTGKPLDLTYCALRGPSIMYTEYLQNMTVKASLTMSLRQEGHLWGLIACHHYQRPIRVSYQLRAVCELVAQVASLGLQLAEDRDQMAYRVRMETIHNQIVSRAAAVGDLTALLQDGHALLDGLAARGAALCDGDRWWTVGDAPTQPQLDALADWLSTRPEWSAPIRPLYLTDSLASAYPAAAAFASVASGVLAFPLSRDRKTLMMWFRPETIQTVSWGGNPHDKPTVLGPHGPRLTPRASFELFRESVRQRSLTWRPVEVEAAARLRMLVMELVIRQAEPSATKARTHEADLHTLTYATRHEIKGPLRSIRAHAHHLLAEAAALDDEHRHKLDVLIQLTQRMDSLLDSLLRFSRAGEVALRFEDVDLDEVVAEAVEIVDVRRFEGQVEIVVPRPLPRAWCDRGRIRDVFEGLLSNALTYNDKDIKRVEVGFIAPDEDHPRPRCPPGTAEQVIYYIRDNGIGIAHEHHERVFGLFKRLHGRDRFGGGSGTGLTVIKRIVERHGGRIWLDSAPTEGTTVYFTVADQENHE